MDKIVLKYWVRMPQFLLGALVLYALLWIIFVHTTDRERAGNFGDFLWWTIGIVAIIYTLLIAIIQLNQQQTKQHLDHVEKQTGDYIKYRQYQLAQIEINHQKWAIALKFFLEKQVSIFITQSISSEDYIEDLLVYLQDQFAKFISYPINTFQLEFFRTSSYLAALKKSIEYVHESDISIEEKAGNWSMIGLSFDFDEHFAMFLLILLVQNTRFQFSSHHRKIIFDYILNKEIIQVHLTYAFNNINHLTIASELRKLFESQLI